MAQKKRRWRLLLWAILLIALTPVLAWILYPVATRWLLSGPRLRAQINVQPQYFLLDYDEAVSDKPGHLTIKNLSIRGSDPNVQWLIRLDSAEVEFEMSALLKRTLRCTSIRGAGLAFSLRNKMKLSVARTADASVLPPIPGFSDPPLRSPDDKFPTPDPKALLLDVRSVSIEHFDDIWVDAYHFRGAARVDGSFQLRPALFAQIGPAKLTFERAFPPASCWMTDDAPEVRELFQPGREMDVFATPQELKRQCERYLQAPTTTPKFSAEQRLELYSRAVEPTLQRELKH